MRFVSLFAGVGGFDLGFEQQGWTCVGQVEKDKKCLEVLAEHWPDVPRHDDVVTAREWADELGLRGRVDVVCGGFPCQDVSVAGRRAGLAGERTGLFWDALAFATHIEARVIILENVAGLLSSNQGRDFGTILLALANAGYDHCEWRLLDSQFFGVPQRRRRVFILAERRAGTGRTGPVFVEREGLRWHPPSSGTQGQDTASPVEGSFAGRSVVAALTNNGLGGGGPDDNLAQAGHLVVQLANSSSMQSVASTITVGTGVRYDPDTESLVVVGEHRD